MALSNIAESLIQELTVFDDNLKFTALINPAVYETQYNALSVERQESVVESGFG